MAAALILDGTRITVGFDPNPQEWGLILVDFFFFCSGLHHMASSQTSSVDASYASESVSKEDTINCAGVSQPQLPRTESKAAGLVPLEELRVPRVRFPVSEGVQMAYFGDVFDTHNCFQRLRNGKVLPENLHTGVNNSTSESTPKPSSHSSRSHPPTPLP